MQFRIRVFRMLDIKIRLIVVSGIANQNVNLTGNGNVVAARAGGNGNGNSGTQITAEECQLSRTAIKTKREDFCLSTDLVLIAQKKEANPTIEAKNRSDEHSRGTVEQHPATIEETRAYFESLYNILVTEVEKVNTVNRKMKEMNTDLTTELARYRGVGIKSLLMLFGSYYY
ncbi:hypothetical protein Tco_1519429 [Tanacetum coccineum]